MTKKLTFLVYHKEYDAFLNNLRDLGVVHIAEKQQGMARSSIQRYRKDSLICQVVCYDKIASEYKNWRESNGWFWNRFSLKGNANSCEVDELLNHKSSLQQQILAYEKELAVLEPWGDFSPESIAKLRDSGYDISLYINGS